MPDDDWALGQNEVDVRNEARKSWNAMPLLRVSEEVWLDRQRQQSTDDDLHQAIEHLRRLNETLAINEDAEQRRQQSITRTLDEIQRLMDG